MNLAYLLMQLTFYGFTNYACSILKKYEKHLIINNTTLFVETNCLNETPFISKDERLSPINIVNK